MADKNVPRTAGPKGDDKAPVAFNIDELVSKAQWVRAHTSERASIPCACNHAEGLVLVDVAPV